MRRPSPDLGFKIIGRGFAILVVVCLGLAAFFAYRTQDFLSRAESTTGTVVSIRRSVHKDTKGRTSVSFYPLIEYAVGGRTLQGESTIGGDSNDYAVGQKVPVLYSPTKPTKMTIDTFAEKWILPIIFGSLGTFFGIFTATFGFVARSLRGYPELKQTGLPVQGKIAGVEVNTMVRVNRKNPWRIKVTCRHPLTGQEVTAFSRNFWTNPEPHLAGATQLPVYFDRSKPKQVYVDAEELESKAA